MDINVKLVTSSYQFAVQFKSLIEAILQANESSYELKLPL